MLAVQAFAAEPAPATWLEQTFHEHHARVFRAAYRVAGTPQTPRDVVQIVFLRLARAGPSRPLTSPGSYLHRAAVNAALDLLRRRKASPAAPLESGCEPAQAPGASLHELAELREALRLALTRLAPRAAEVFTLRHLEGLDNREIARLLGTSSAVVAVTLHRARRRLKKDLAASSAADRGRTRTMWRQSDKPRPNNLLDSAATAVREEALDPQTERAAAERGLAACAPRLPLRRPRDRFAAARMSARSSRRMPLASFRLPGRSWSRITSASARLVAQLPPRPPPTTGSAEAPCCRGVRRSAAPWAPHDAPSRRARHPRRGARRHGGPRWLRLLCDRPRRRRCRARRVGQCSTAAARVRWLGASARGGASLPGGRAVRAGQHGRAALSLATARVSSSPSAPSSPSTRAAVTRPFASIAQHHRTRRQT